MRRFSDLELELDELSRLCQRRYLRHIESRVGTRVTIGGKECIIFSSNDYLGLSMDPRIGEFAVEMMRKYGFGAGASRLISGSLKLHEELEEILAHWKGTPSALVFNSGYNANVGILSALLREGDFVYSDALNHASIIDGCRLSRATVRVYEHLNLDHLEDLLRKDSFRKGRRIIVTDSVFSMDGDIAPLKELSKIADRYGAWLMVDEAHATGVLGEEGKGVVAMEGLTYEEVPIQMGTLSKALGGFGAFVAGEKILREYLLNRARSFIYTTALPVPVIASAIKAIEIVRKESWRRERVLSHSRFLRQELKALGYEVKDGITPIIPVLFHDDPVVMAFSQALLEMGILAVGIRPPTGPKGTSRIRITVSSLHTEDDLKELISVFSTLAPIRDGEFH
jgi:8-amino-7-oxononanoate synthase